MDAIQLNDWKLSPKYPLLICEKDGRKRIWACWVKGNEVFRTDGFLGGKLKEPLGHKYEGNTIKTAEEQAESEAEKAWIKQIGIGYKPLDDDLNGNEIYKYVMSQKSKNGGMNRGVKMFGETGITGETTAGFKDFSKQHRPMLAKKYKEPNENGELGLTTSGKSIKFPALVQAKVDGIRALPRIDESGNVVLESRNGNCFMYLNHVRDEIKYWLKKKGCEDLILDGELYIHKCYRNDVGEPTYNWTSKEMKGVERYQFISEACKITRSEKHKFESMIEYWVFDIWNPNMTNKERWNVLNDLFKDYDGDIIKIVPTKIVRDHQEIEDFMNEMIGINDSRLGYEYEGVMIRQMDSKYVASTTHSSCLLKYKRFEDDEWQVYGAERCNGGNSDGSIKWLCKKIIGGKEVCLVAKQTGDVEISKKMYTEWEKNPTSYINKMINIRYNETSKDGVPRFPRATSFVEDKS